MIAKEELLFLKTKILPTGADSVVDFLATRHEQVEFTNIVLENVPLLIIGRHGMIARLPVGGAVQKVSKPAEILAYLRNFFLNQDVLYLFVNLPDLPVPSEVTDLLDEVQRRHEEKEHLRKRVDEALESRDKDAFMQASHELNRLMAATTIELPKNRRFIV